MKTLAEQRMRAQHSKIHFNELSSYLCIINLNYSKNSLLPSNHRLPLLLPLLLLPCFAFVQFPRNLLAKTFIILKFFPKSFEQKKIHSKSAITSFKEHNIRFCFETKPIDQRFLWNDCLVQHQTFHCNHWKNSVWFLWILLHLKLSFMRKTSRNEYQRPFLITDFQWNAKTRWVFAEVSNASFQWKF